MATKTSLPATPAGDTGRPAGLTNGPGAATRLWALTVTVALLALIVPRLPSYYVGLVTLVLIYALFAMSMDILIGYTGLVTLGHGAFLGVAGYVAALLSLKVIDNFLVDVAAALLAAGILAALFGLIALRATGPYFLMITMGLAQLPWGVAIRWRSLTGGDDGLPGIRRPKLGLPWSLDDSTTFFLFTLLVTAVCGVMMYAMMRSSFGRSLLGIHQNAARMKALGYNVWLYRYVAFIVAGIFAGVAGVVFAYYNRFISPDNLSVVTSAEGMIMVILGGAGTLVGPVLGAAGITLLHGVIGHSERWTMILGAIYILVTLAAPRGLFGLAVDWSQRRSERRSRLEAAAAEMPAMRSQAG